MSRDEAIRRATNRAKASGKGCGVVCESGEWDTANDHELDTFFLGTEPTYWVEPDGEVTS